MARNKRLITLFVVFCVCVFVVTYYFHSWKISREVASLGAAVSDLETEEPGVDISAVKIGYDGITYTIDEFLKLNEKPTVVDILVMQEDGTLDNKPAYISYGEEDYVQYVDGVYGRLILPQEYNTNSEG